MPKDFLRCVKNKGRIRTVKPTKTTYIRICYDKYGSHSGEVKHNKTSTCKGKCTNGKKCRRRTKSKYCWIHS